MTELSLFFVCNLNLSHYNESEWCVYFLGVFVMERIETERLLLREIKRSDIIEIFNCWMRDEDVSKYMFWKASDDINDVKEFVEHEMAQLYNERWNRWIITLKESETIIGTCLLYYDEEGKHWDVSYNLGKKYWNKGYTYEAMKSVMKYGIEKLDMKECITSYALENVASARLLHKLGFVDESETDYICNGGDIHTRGMICRWKA